MRLIEALVAAGVTRIEAVAFVSPKAVPAMAGAAEVLAAVPRSAGVRYSALVPNVRGAELALECDVDELTVTASLSETYSQRNVRMSIDESADAIAGICAVAGDVPVDAVLSCSFGSPYEGDIAPAEVRGAGRRACATAAARPSPAPTPPAWPRPAGSPRWSTPSAPTSGSTSTRPVAPRSCRAYAGAAARHHPVRHLGRRARRLAVRGRARRATSPPRSWSPCSTTSASRTGIDVEALIEAAHLAGELVGRDGPEPGGGGRPPHPPGQEATDRAALRHLRPLLQPEHA